MYRFRTTLTLAALALAGLAASCAKPIGDGDIDSFVVHAVLEPDGNLVVTESIDLGSGPEALTRVIDSEFADGAEFIEFAVDDRPIEPGGALAVDATADHGLAVRWTPATSADAGTSVRLRYMLERVAAVGEPRGRLEWNALLPGHRHNVADARLRLDLPEGSRFHDGTGIGQAGWTVTVDGGQLEATRSGIGAGEAATLLAVFDVDRRYVQQSDWERDLDLRGQFYYALVAAGLFIVVIGFGILIVLRLQYPPPARVPADEREKLVGDRQMVARGLKTSAIASLLLALALAGAAALWLASLGPAVYAIPGSIAFVAALLLVSGFWYGR